MHVCVCDCICTARREERSCSKSAHEMPRQLTINPTRCQEDGQSTDDPVDLVLFLADHDGNTACLQVDHARIGRSERGILRPVQTLAAVRQNITDGIYAAGIKRAVSMARGDSTPADAM